MELVQDLEQWQGLVLEVLNFRVLLPENSYLVILFHLFDIIPTKTARKG